MRCPYCGGLNSDRARYCASCGRDMTVPVSRPPAQRAPVQQPPYQQPPYQQPRQGQPAQSYPTPTPQQAPPRTQQGRPATSVRPPQPPPNVVPVEPPAPEAPAPFPPRTVDHLQTLAQGALAYTVTQATTNGNRKKIVRIVYPRCVAWQQVATLYKAWKEQQEAHFESIIIEGYHTQDASEFSFTNGQLTFDRNVRLGSQTMNRYLIETGNGYANDSVRIILSE
ncbi:MAG: hypothetical protein ACJ788_05430 [Ktedonobacteraceae bacterium]